MALAAVVVGALAATAAAPQARADVCTGGYPGAASGTPPPALLSAVPLLARPRYGAETLPQWRTTQTSSAWGNEAAVGWYGDVALVSAQRGASWWVMPTQSCGGTDQVCVLVASELTQVSFDCLDPSQIAAGSPPRAVAAGDQWLIAGFAPAGAGSVTIQFANGTRVLPASGGVYAGRVPTRLGAVGSASFQTAAVAAPVAPMVLVDQTGIFSKSMGPLASTSRLRAIAARLRAHLSVTPTILGTAIRGHRARTTVLYAPGFRRTALGSARVLHAGAPRPLSPAQRRMFGAVARVVILAGRS